MEARNAIKSLLFPFLPFFFFFPFFFREPRKTGGEKYKNAAAFVPVGGGGEGGGEIKENEGLGETLGENENRPAWGGRGRGQKLAKRSATRG